MKNSNNRGQSHISVSAGFNSTLTPIIRIYIALMFASVSACAYAEYEIMTKAENPDQYRWFGGSGNSIDLEACQAVVENMNILESYHVDMKDDFSLTSKVPLLSRPAWRKVDKSEYEEFWNFHGRGKAKYSYGNDPTSLYVYNIFIEEKNSYINIYKLDVPYVHEGKNKIGIHVYFIEKKDGRLIPSETFWSGHDDTHLGVDDSDVILYKNRIYLFRYVAITGEKYSVSSVVFFGDAGRILTSRKDLPQVSVGLVNSCHIKSKILKNR